MATNANIFIDQGSSFNLVIDLSTDTTDYFDLTNYNARGQIRKSYGSSDFLPFTMAFPGNVDGELTASLTAEQTGLLKAGTYVYDIEIYMNDSPIEHITRITEGIVVVDASVTQAFPTGEGIGIETPTVVEDSPIEDSPIDNSPIEDSPIDNSPIEDTP